MTCGLIPFATGERRRRWIPVSRGCELATLGIANLPAVECLSCESRLGLQGQGIKIGSSTGFTRPMVDILEKAAKKQGYVPDASLAGDEVLHGARPRPFMVYRNLDLLDDWPIESVIKIDDTTSGVGEGLNAGCWAVGMARYSNYMNINTLEEEATLSKAESRAGLLH